MRYVDLKCISSWHDGMNLGYAIKSGIYKGTTNFEYQQYLELVEYVCGPVMVICSVQTWIHSEVAAVTFWAVKLCKCSIQLCY